MDWGLLDSNAGENKFLREEVVYSSAVSIFFLIIINYYIRKYLLCRFLIKKNFITELLLLCHH